MLLRTYYALKPYLPLRLRYWLRAQRARVLRSRYQDSWPIAPKAGIVPAGWRGWPEGKQFAFVLTHDVEGPLGYEKVKSLAAIEEGRGFRSSFHFVPEGTYTVSAELRTELVARGFEVGVHDLHHNGSLYASPASFKKQASRINYYLREWESSGFRAGFMFHNLDWICEHLACAHDMSTFDTDPFEPQNDGVCTIFPFEVSAGTQSRALPKTSLVELPYTLPQDSTLFLILGEESPKIWLEKLDWIASCGGMALVNVHPDYLRLRKDESSSATYPVDHYTALLDHVKTRYGSKCWHALPRDVAAWLRQGSPEKISAKAESEMRRTA